MERSSATRRREFLKYGVMFGLLALARPLRAYSPPLLTTIQPPNAIDGSQPPCLSFALPHSFTATGGAPTPQVVNFTIFAKHTTGNATFHVAKLPDSPEWTIIAPAPIWVPPNKALPHTFQVQAKPGAPKIEMSLAVKLDTKMGCWGTGTMPLVCK